MTKKVAFSFGGNDFSGGFTPIAPGTYKAEISEVQFVQSSTGKPMFVAVYHIESENRNLFDYMVLDVKTLWKIQGFLSDGGISTKDSGWDLTEWDEEQDNPMGDGVVCVRNPDGKRVVKYFQMEDGKTAVPTKAKGTVVVEIQTSPDKTDPNKTVEFNRISEVTFDEPFPEYTEEESAEVISGTGRKLA